MRGRRPAVNSPYSPGGRAYRKSKRITSKDIECPRCGSGPLEPCFGFHGYRTNSHAERIELAKQLTEGRRMTGEGT